MRARDLLVHRPGGARGRGRGRLWAIAGAALHIAACGGTTGLEDIDTGAPAADVQGTDAQSGSDVTTEAGNDAGAEAGADGDLDAPADAPSFDATLDSPAEGGDEYDRAERVRPPPQDVSVYDVQEAAADTGPDVTVDAGPDPCGPNSDTATCLRAQDKTDAGRDASTRCSSCIVASGCLDPMAGGNTCETPPIPMVPHFPMAFPDGKKCSDLGIDVGGITPEPRVCLATLRTIFKSQCAQMLTLTPCLCGSADVAGCLAGTTTPLGPAYDLYSCDFDSTSSTTIQSDFQVQTYGAGAANAIALCAAQSMCDCF